MGYVLKVNVRLISTFLFIAPMIGGIRYEESARKKQKSISRNQSSESETDPETVSKVSNSVFCRMIFRLFVFFVFSRRN